MAVAGVVNWEERDRSSWQQDVHAATSLAHGFAAGTRVAAVTRERLLPISAVEQVPRVAARSGTPPAPGIDGSSRTDGRRPLARSLP